MPIGNYRYFLAGSVFFALALILFFILASVGWPGMQSNCIDGSCYCEALHADTIGLEPVNTWSNLGLVISGLGILWYLGRCEQRQAASENRTSQPDRKNPMTAPGFYSVLYGFTVISIGIGSMFFHGSLTQWGGLLDNLSMNLFVTFLIFYDLVRLTGVSKQRFLLIHVSFNSLFGVLAWIPDVGRYTFTALVGVIVTFELLLLLKSGAVIKRLFPSARRFHRNWILYVFSVGTFMVAFLIWNLSKSGAPLCVPDSIFQGHAVWHYLVALSTGFIFLYLRTEKPFNVI